MEQEKWTGTQCWALQDWGLGYEDQRGLPWQSTSQSKKGTFCCFQSLSLCFTENNLFTSFSLIYLRNRFEHDKREDLLHKHLGQELRYCQLFGFVFMYLFDERMLMPCWGWGVSTMCIPGTEFKLSDVMVSTITTSLHLTVFNILFF